MALNTALKKSAVTTLLFLRHAETVWNAEHRYAGSQEVALSSEAKTQITIITKRLQKEVIGAIYTSPLRRCLETIAPLAQHFHLRPVICQDLIERNLGEWEGKSSAELPLPSNHSAYQFPDSAYSGQFHLNESERLEHLQKRVRRVMDDIHTHHPGQTVLISTHAGVIWTLQKYLVNNPPPVPSWPGNCALYRVVQINNHYTLVASDHGL